MTRIHSAAAVDLARTALGKAPVFDGHNDLPSALRETGYAVEGMDSGRPLLHTDIPRLRAGGVGAQFWSVFVPSTLSEPEAAVATLEQVDLVYRLVARYPDTFAIAYTAADVTRAIDSGRIASLLGVEGGHSIATSLGVLRAFARLGVRYMTLTHNDNTSWADSATDVPAVGGLNEVGRAVVAEMNRIGVLVDLSHVAESTMNAALDIATSPVIFSHSSCRAVCPHPRNVPDAVLARLASNGGVVQLTFVPAFISPAAADWWLAARAQAGADRAGVAAYDWPRAPRPGESADEVAAEIAEIAERKKGTPDENWTRWLAENPRPEVSLAEVADHVDHAREVAGIEHIGIGGDYDGVDRQPAELVDVSRYPLLLAELAQRGWSESDLTALTGRNVLRVLQAADDAATEPLWPVGPLR